MTVLVTGGNGYIGRYLVEGLVKAGYGVYQTTHKDRWTLPENVRYLDLSEDSSCIDVCSGMDVVVHTATMDERRITSDAKSALEINAYGTRQLFMDAVRCGVKKFIYLSTFHVYGKQCGTIDESTQPEPENDYGLTHYFAEQYLRQMSANSACETYVLRLTNGVGIPLGNTDKWYLAINDFCKSAFEEQQISLKSNGLSLRDFVAIHDLVAAVKMLMGKPYQGPFEIYNVSAQHSISIREAARLVADIYSRRYGCRCKLLIPDAAPEEKSGVQPLLVLSEKLCGLGWQPQETLEETIDSIFEGLEQSAAVFNLSSDGYKYGGKCSK